MTLYERWRSNKFIGLIWRIKSYFDIANTQTGWVTGKAVDIMGVLFIFEKFGIIVEGATLAILMVFVFIGMVTFGLMFKKAGLYDGQQEAATNLNAVTKEMYDAAKLINKRYKKK